MLVARHKIRQYLFLIKKNCGMGNGLFATRPRYGAYQPFRTLRGECSTSSPATESLQFCTNPSRLHARRTPSCPGSRRRMSHFLRGGRSTSLMGQRLVVLTIHIIVSIMIAMLANVSGLDEFVSLTHPVRDECSKVSDHLTHLAV